MNPDFEILLARYFDDEISHEEVILFAEMIKTDLECKRLFQKELRLNVLLREVSLEEIASKKEKNPKKQKTPIRKKVPSRFKNARPNSNRSLVWWSMAASFAVIAGGLCVFLKDRQEPMQPFAVLAVLTEKQSIVKIERKQKLMTVECGFSLVAGDIIRTERTGGAILKFTDSTSLDLKPSTSIVLNPSPIKKDPGKQVKILNGAIAAQVEKQRKGYPMIFLTHNAKAVVLGTRLEIQASEKKTVLKVTEGLVNFRLLSEKDGRDVAAGEEAEAYNNSIKVITSSSNPKTKLQSKDPPEENLNKDERIITDEGTVIGKVKKTGKGFVEVTSVSGKTAHYIPEWKGGIRGGYDKKIVNIISNLKAGDKVSVKWYLNDHLRIKDIELIQGPED